MKKRSAIRALPAMVLVALLLPVAAVQGQGVGNCVPPPSGLVSWWPGDGNGNDIIGSNHGTPLNGVTFAPGVVGQAFSFGGGDDLVDAGSDSSLDDIQVKTIDAWVRWNGLQPFGSIAEKGDSISFTQGWFLYIRGHGGENRLEFTQGFSSGPGDGLAVWNTPVGSITPGEFIHVAVVYDGSIASNVPGIYINGVAQVVTLRAGYAPSGPPISDAPFRLVIGNNPIGSNAWDGLIDEVEIYNRALSSEEIQAIFAAGSAGKCKAISIEIDIKPGSIPNSINPRSQGKIPVAILTTDTFDATTVDPLTVRFGATGTEAAAVKYALEDVDADGDTDLVLHFKNEETGLTCQPPFGSLGSLVFYDRSTFLDRPPAIYVGVDLIEIVGCK